MGLASISGLANSDTAKLDVKQGLANAGKYMVVGPSGEIIPEALADATATAHGLMSAEDKAKLEKIPVGGTVTTVHTTAAWRELPDYIAARGEIVVYSDHGSMVKNGETIPVPGVKIGDGLAYAVDLPFVGEDVAADILAQLGQHTSDTTVHITSAEREKWNNKLNYTMSGETLAFNRL